MRKIFLFSISLALLCYSFQSFAQTEVRNYIFGHSLLDHRPPINPTPADETTVPHWLNILAQNAGHQYSVSGQYGFLPQHANLPPSAQWGYAHVPSAWESDYEDFTEADFTTAIITAGNFIQWQGPSEPYWNEETLSPLIATQQISDWLLGQEDQINIYIYENWPDMASFIAGELFPPSSDELDNYYGYTLNDFHLWWLEYQDLLKETRPDHHIKMIPVGPILSDLHSSGYLDGIPVTELFEDNAPHGRPNIYYLAALVTYMAIYQEKPLDILPPSDQIHSEIKNNHQAIIDLIWNELLDFNYDDGESRVFIDSPTSAIKNTNLEDDCLLVSYNPSFQYIKISNRNNVSPILIYNSAGSPVKTINDLKNDFINISDLPPGLYYIKNGNGAKNTCVSKFIKY